jgi:hypothetical protein
VSRLQISALFGGLGLLLAFALAPALFPSPAFHAGEGAVIPLLVLIAAAIVSARNAFDSRGHTRLFWSLVASGCAMWCMSQAYWTWYEAVLREPRPTPALGDIVLFLHGIPIMAAVAIRPHQADENEGVLPSALNVIILLVWWIVVYAFFVFPDEYLATDVAGYKLRRDLLYRAEELILIAVSASAYFTSTGSWRGIYRNIFFASVVYTLSLETMNAFEIRGIYKSGGIYGLPFLAALMGFLWAAIAGRHCLRDTEMSPSITRRSRPVAPVLAKLALLSLPLMGYWAMFLSHDPPYLRHVRFNVTMGGVAVLAFVVLLKQHLLDRRLLLLLNHSRKSFDNLQRLQGRVIQQAKLA